MTGGVTRARADDPRTTPSSDRHRPVPEGRWVWIALGLAGLLYAIVAIKSLRQDSVTVDEFGHLPVGYNVVRTGDFRYCELNPPLMNVLSALPILAMDPEHRIPIAHPRGRTGHSFWANGYLFMSRYADRYQALFVAARCMTVLVVGLLGVLLFIWGRSLVPEQRSVAGLMSAVLVWFSPGILAHARLVTTDAGAASFFALAVFGFQMFLRKPGAARGALAGLSLGLAQLVKFTSVYLYPVALVQAFVWHRRSRGSHGWSLTRLCLVVFVMSLLTINAGYMFQESGRTLGSFRFASAPYRLLNSALPAWTPVPLPASYVRAFDQQLSDAEVGDPSYLYGRSYRGGKWYYFAALLPLKTPLPLLVLALLGAGLALSGKGLRTMDQFLLLLPVVLVIVVFSVFSNKQLGLRMILPAAPIFWLWVSATLARSWRRPWVPRLVLPLLAWFAVTSLRAYPDYLAYFNPLAGGPAGGYRYALDSNLDWGQGLVRLKRYLDATQSRSVQLLYFGRVAPEIYGIDYEVPVGAPHPGLLAVSPTLYGRGYMLFDHGKLIWTDPMGDAGRRLGERVRFPGYSLHLYQVPRSPEADAGAGSQDP